MSSRVHPVVGVLALLVALVVIAMVYGRRLQEPPPQSASGAGMMRGAGRRGRMGGGGGGMAAPELGIIGGPSNSPQGFKVSAFESSANPSPLKLMGVKEGDVIVSVNGGPRNVRALLGEAIKALQTEGKPIVLLVNRDGKELTLKWDKKLPAAATEAVEKATPPGGGGAGPATGRRGR